MKGLVWVRTLHVGIFQAFEACQVGWTARPGSQAAGDLSSPCLTHFSNSCPDL